MSYFIIELHQGLHYVIETDPHHQHLFRFETRARALEFIYEVTGGAL